MKKYSYFLKEPIFIEWKEEVVRVKLIEYDSIPKYHIVDDNVYVLLQALNVEGKRIGLPIYLSITISKEEFLESIKSNIEELPL